MKTQNDFFDKLLNEQLIQAVLSGPRRKDGASRVKIRPVELKGEIYYQASAFVGNQVLHSNYTREEVCEYLEKALDGSFSQLQVQGLELDGTILVSKKGKVTIRTKQKADTQKTGLKGEGDRKNGSKGEDSRKNDTNGEDGWRTGERPARILSHNRVKQYILKEGIPVPFLVDLGVMTAGGKIVASRYDKFRQINRFLEYIEDILPQLPRDREITILDFGCGKSYLTFAMYYYLRELRGYDVNIIGLDLKTDVIRKCSHLAETYGYEKLHFYQGDIADYEGVSSVDMVVTLHACDTATDYALAKAVEWGAEVILSVPCCQHELNRQIRNEMLSPVLHYGILKERMAALMTDGIRAQLLEEQGYDTQILEFIDMEHIPKNLLIRAVRKEKVRHAHTPALEDMMRKLHVSPTLAALLKPRPETERKGE